ncbi:MAG: S9 family peptidase [Bacteroidales bacterium]|nr:S9 family peptidase [Bacteroidales bacterium]
MKKLHLLVSVFALFSIIACKQQIKVTYPDTAKVDTVNDYFGTLVADPYRWLENDTSAETEAWVSAENAVTDEYLAQIPYREQVRNRLEKIWDYPKYGVPFQEGNYFFFFKNDGLQNQSVLYIKNGIDGEPEMLLDPNTFSEDGTIALAGLSVSHDARYLAYSLATSGSDWNEIHVMEIEGRNVLPDVLNWVKFSGMSWEKDGFYYSRYDEPVKGLEYSNKNEFHKVFYHKVGTPQSADILIFQDLKYPLRNYGVSVTDDEHFLILYQSESTSGNALYYKDLTKKNSKFQPLVTGFENDFSVVDNLGDNLLVVTNYEAPKKMLVLMDPTQPQPDKWTILIPEQEDVLGSVDMAGDKLVAEYMYKAASIAKLYDYSGNQLGEIELPAVGTLAGFSGKKGENVAFYGFTSYTFPTTIFKYDLATNLSEVYIKPELDFDPEKYIVKQVEYPSKDGTLITMFIVHQKDLKLDGNNPTLLYGYGGFNISMTPGFSVTRLAFIEQGGVYAVPNLRGGGEYGEEWHKAGTLERKQNVFDDFIAAAEYLIEEKYTSSEKLAIMGGSNGGLLVGACMTQRPELFKVAIPAVGVMDMLRYHKFTIGWAWATDYGTSETEEGFNYLIKYSPIHNIREGVSYPATLVTTADHDDRVVPAHSFKFIARLQAADAGPNPVLVRIETKAGHGGGKPTSKVIEEYGDIWSFMFWNLGMTPKF